MKRPGSTRMPACFAGRCGRQRNSSRSPGDTRRQAFPRNGGAPRRGTVPRPPLPPNPAHRPPAVPAPRHRPHARRPAPGRGSRSRRPCASPGAGMACPPRKGPRPGSPRRHRGIIAVRSWHQRAAVEVAAVHDIAIGRVVAGQMRKAPEIDCVGEFRLAGRELLVATGGNWKTRRQRSRADPLPGRSTSVVPAASLRCSSTRSVRPALAPVVQVSVPCANHPGAKFRARSRPASRAYRATRRFRSR